MKTRTLYTSDIGLSGSIFFRIIFQPQTPAVTAPYSFHTISYNFLKENSLLFFSSAMPRNNKKAKSAPPPRPRGPGKPSGPSSNPAKGQQHGNGQKQGSGNANAPKKASMQANQRPIVPFLRKDRILLVGEGELFLLF